MTDKHEYYYKGAVMVNNRLNDQDYRTSTYASSDKEARRNIIYQYKEYANVPSNAIVELVSKPVGEDLWVFNGDVYIKGDIKYVGYRDAVNAFNEESARIRLINRYRRRQFLSDECNITFKGELTKKEK